MKAEIPVKVSKKGMGEYNEGFDFVFLGHRKHRQIGKGDKREIHGAGNGGD